MKGYRPQAEQSREIMPTSSVLDIIEPSDPDSLQHIGNGLYEAKWVDGKEAREEIARLRRTSRIAIIGEEYQPEHLPDWVAVRFTIAPLPLQVIETLQ